MSEREREILSCLKCPAVDFLQRTRNQMARIQDEIGVFLATYPDLEIVPPSETKPGEIPIGSVESHENLIFNPSCGEIWSGSKRLSRFPDLPSRVFSALVERSNEVVTYEDILLVGWPDEVNDPCWAFSNQRTHSVIKRIRRELKKISPELDNQLESFPMKGYRWNNLSLLESENP